MPEALGVYGCAVRQSEPIKGVLLLEHVLDVLRVALQETQMMGGNKKGWRFRIQTWGRNWREHGGIGVLGSEQSV